MIEMSALVVTYNSAEEIESCLDALLAQEVEGGLEIVVVDNASSDDTASKLDAYGERVRFIRNDVNVGYAPGVNQAFAASSGRLVALVNPDCTLDPGCLGRLSEHLQTSPGVGVAAALLRNADGTPQLFARREADLVGVLLTLTDAGQELDRRLLGGRAMADRRYEDAFAEGLVEPQAVDCPAAACVVAWRRLLEPRPMDPQLPLMFNDAELYRRLRAKGYRCEVVPDATASHLYGSSLRRVPTGRMRAEFVAALRRYASTWPWPKRSALWLGLVADAAVGVAATSRAGGSATAARGRARGTLGGLGLPGGVRPWLSPPPSPRSAARGVKARLQRAPRSTAQSSLRRVRRRWFLFRLRLAGMWVGSRVDLDVHPTADLGWTQQLEIRPRSHVVIRIGERARIRNGVILRLGGTLDVGPACDVRWRTSLNVNGSLTFEGRNALGLGVSCHADGDMRWEFGASAAEYATIVDSDHAVDGSILNVLDQPVQQGDIRLGGGAFLGAHAVVTAGCRLGAGSVAGANSVVTRDVPAGVVVAGAPARPVKSLPHGRHQSPSS